MARFEDIHQYQTVDFGYIYDSDRGDGKGKIAAGAPCSDLPEEWRYPICGGSRKCFRPLAGPGSTKEAGCELPTK